MQTLVTMVIYAYLVIHNQNDSTNLQKTSMFVCVPNIKFIIHFFLEMLHFKELCNFIDWQTLAPSLEIQSFARYGVDISIAMSVFTLDYFQEKLMTTFFKKSKKIYFGAMALFWTFLPKFGQIWIFVEKSLYQFLNIPIIFHRVKNQKKTNMPFLRKILNWRMDGQTEGSSNNHDFVESSAWQGSNYQSNVKLSWIYI